jgi:hypothetical protein
MMVGLLLRCSSLLFFANPFLFLLLELALPFGGVLHENAKMPITAASGHSQIQNSATARVHSDIEQVS